MNIIGGKFRGKKMVEYFNETTRPTTSRVRENIFNVLGGLVNSSTVLDLFAGTGLYGVEALSRSARSVVFNDVDSAAVSVIRKNLGALKSHGCETQVLNLDAFAALKKLGAVQFDIIFLDPPYNSDMGERAVDYIINHNVLAPEGVIVLETDVANAQLVFKGLEVRIKEYGRARIYFLGQRNTD